MWTASLQKKMTFYLVKIYHKCLKKYKLNYLTYLYKYKKEQKNTLDNYRGYLYLITNAVSISYLMNRRNPHSAILLS